MKSSIATFTMMFVLVGAASANLLLNPGFSPDLSNWTVNPTGSDEISTETWGSHDGDGYMLAFSSWNGGDAVSLYQDVAAAPSYEYTVDFWLEGETGWAGTFGASMIWLDSGKNPVGTPVTLDLMPWAATTAPWTNLSMQGTSPSGTAFVRVQLSADSSGTGAGKIDDITMIPEPTTLSLLGLAFAGLMGIRRRRNRS